MIGYNYKDREPKNIEHDYSDKVGSWVKVYTDIGAFEGKLERLTDTQFKLNPKATPRINNEGWQEYQIRHSELSYDLIEVKGMEKTTKNAIQNFCNIENEFSKQEFYNKLENLGLIDNTQSCVILSTKMPK